MPNKRPRKPIDVSEMATILTFGDTFGDKAASEKFGVSERTLQRRRRDLAAGRCPELAELVAKNTKRVTSQNEQLLDRVYNASLEAILLRVQTRGEDRMSDRDLVGVAHILGNQKITRDAYDLDGDDDDPAASDSPSAEATGHSPRTEGAQAPSAAIH